jgi:hypothetical protein
LQATLAGLVRDRGAVVDYLQDLLPGLGQLEGAWVEQALSAYTEVLDLAEPWAAAESPLGGIGGWEPGVREALRGQWETLAEGDARAANHLRRSQEASHLPEEQA